MSMKKKSKKIDDTRQSIRDELNAQKPEWVREITESVAKALGEKIDKIYVKLDKFIGEMKAFREGQELHQGQHDQVDARLTRVEKKLNLPAIVD